MSRETLHIPHLFFDKELTRQRLFYKLETQGLDIGLLLLWVEYTTNSHNL